MAKNKEKIAREIHSLKSFSQYLQICEFHWQETWLPSTAFLQNKNCVDIGIWKGILNAKAKKYMNCVTNIGIEPDTSHRLDCQKLNPGIKLYTTIDDVQENIITDVILLHGVICLMGEKWQSELNQILKKISCNSIHVRHTENFEKGMLGQNRETNRYNLKNYTHSPTVTKLIDFFEKHNYTLLTIRNTSNNSKVLELRK